MAAKKLKKPTKMQKRILRKDSGIKSQKGKARASKTSIATRRPAPATADLKSPIVARPSPTKSKTRRKSASRPAPTAQAAEDEATALPPLPILMRVEPSPTKVIRETRVVGQKAKSQMPKSPKVQPSDFQSEIEALKAQLAAMRMALENPATRVEPSPPSTTAATPPADSPLPATIHPLPATATEQLSAIDSPVSPAPSDLAAQVTTLSEQISALRSQFSTLDSRPSTQPQVSASSPATSYPPPATAAKPLPIYELKETHPVGYQSQDIFDSSTEESQDGFFTGLLDRARMQWLMGDWEGLSNLDLDQIQHHPDRAKLALLVSAGLMQGGQADLAKQHLAQAYRWGVPKKLAFSILYSGVRQSLHQATHGNIAGSQLLNGGSSESNQVERPRRAESSESAIILSRLTEILESIQTLSSNLAQGVKNLSDELIRVRKFLDAVINREVKNAARQVQASAAVQHYIERGDLLPFHPESDSWPISPDFAYTLLHLLETRDYDLIVEFGSGLSTVLVARSLAKLDLKRPDKPPTRFLSFDHLPEYHDRTRDLLRQADLVDRVELCLAPLADYSAPNGRTYPYYSCQERISAFAGAQPLAGLKVLAIIDGPPQATGEHARYPAGPLLAKVFQEASLDLLLDDLIREDERQVAKMWEEEFQAAGRSCKSRILKLQKEACLLQVS
jgi:hypothetical protein